MVQYATTVYDFNSLYSNFPFEQYVNPEETTQEMTGTLIWDLSIQHQSIPAVAIPASVTNSTKPIDAYCHQVDLEMVTCNCSNFAPDMKCLVSIMSDQLVQELNGTSLETPDLDSVQEYEFDTDISGPEEPADEFYSESFTVTGSYNEDRYQTALLKCSDAIRRKESFPIRVLFEPNNIEDKNAIKFEVYFDNSWLIIGYCAVKKIPKLNKAIRKKEIETVSLLYVRIQWIPWKSSLCFYACANIVKKRTWTKDDPNNHYNSNVEIS